MRWIYFNIFWLFCSSIISAEEPRGYFVNPIFAPDGKQIIATNESYSALYIISTEEIGFKRIFSGTGCGFKPSFSPRSAQIGFKRIKDGLQTPIILNLKTGELTELHRPVKLAGEVSFSNTGLVAFTIGKDLIIDKRGSPRNRIHLGYYSNIAPISPDGKWVVFNDDNDQLWLINTDGTLLRQLTSSDNGYFDPKWAPDSKRLAISELGKNLIVIDIESGLSYELGEGRNPQWSPDASQVVYYITETDGHELTGSDLYLINWDGTGKTKLTDTHLVLEQNPSFSPDGNEIVFSTYKKREICIGKLIDKKLKSIRIIAKTEKPLRLNYLRSEEVKKTSYSLLPTSYFSVPYIHQVYDTPNWFNGHSACAPSAAMMAIQYYNILPSWPCTVSVPYEHESLFGRYVCEEYTYNSYTYSDLAQDPSGNWAKGGYGYMWCDDYSPRSRMPQYILNHGLHSWLDESPTWAEVTTEADSNYPFPLCCGLTGAGHIITLTGYIGDQHTVIANDPYGDKNTPGYPSYDGKDVYYDWPGYNSGNENLNNVYYLVGAQGREWVTNGIVVDDQDPGFEKFGTPSYWWEANCGWQGHIYWTYSGGDAVDNWAKWTPELPDTGIYRVYTHIPDNYASTENAVYKIHHKNGINYIAVNQNAYSNEWISIGTYPFGSGYIELTDSTTEPLGDKYIGFDAIKWLYLDSSYVWDFDSTGDTEDWTNINNIDDFYTQNGYLYARVTGNDPIIRSSWLSFQSSEYPYVEIRFKVTAGDSVQLFFITTDDPVWNEQKSKILLITDHSEFIVYRFDMSNNSLWSGHTISRLRIDPNCNAPNSDVYIDYIKVTLPKATVWLDNGTIKVGVNLDWGGAISNIEYQEFNLVDNHDAGRLIQASFYGESNWNPVQGGDKFNQGSPVLNYWVSDDTIYTKTQPRDWNTGALTDVYIEQWVTFADSTILKVDYRMTYWGSENYSPCDQEFPCAYLDSSLYRCITYTDTNPWTDDTVDEYNITPGEPGQPNTYFYPTEYWASFVNDADFGLTLYSADHTPYWAANRFSIDTKPSYLVTVDQFAIGPATVEEATEYLIVANYQDARSWIYEHEIGIEENVSCSPDKIGIPCLKVYPNPFSHKTSIQYSVASSQGKNKNLSTITPQGERSNYLPSTICIYDLSGRLVRSFPINQSTNQLINCITWDGTDNHSKEVKSGVYFCRLQAGKKVSTKKLILLR